MRYLTAVRLAGLFVTVGVLAACATQTVGIVYIADSQNNRIRAVSLATGIITTVAGTGVAGYSGDGGTATSAELNNPYGVAVDLVGNLYIADSLNNRVRMVSRSTGVITTVAGTGVAGFAGDGGAATNAWLWNPTGVAVDGLGNVYVADQRNNRIRKVSGGTISTVAGNGEAGYSGDGGAATSAALYYPTGIALDEFGFLYIADTNNQRIREVVSGVITTIGGTGAVGYSCAIGPAGNVGLHSPTGVSTYTSGYFAVADSGNQCVRTFAAGADFLSFGNEIPSYGGDGLAADNAAVELNCPAGVAVDPLTENLYIADDVNHRIRIVAVTGAVISTFAGNGTAGFSGDGGPASSAHLYNPTGVVVFDPGSGS